MGVDASVPMTSLTVHTTMSPACAVRPEWADRIFSLMVCPGMSLLPGGAQHVCGRSGRSHLFHGRSFASSNPRGSYEIAQRVDHGSAHVERAIDARHECDAR